MLVSSTMAEELEAVLERLLDERADWLDTPDTLLLEAKEWMLEDKKELLLEERLLNTAGREDAEQPPMDAQSILSMDELLELGIELPPGADDAVIDCEELPTLEPKTWLLSELADLALEGASADLWMTETEDLLTVSPRPPLPPQALNSRMPDSSTAKPARTDIGERDLTLDISGLSIKIPLYH